MDSLVSSALATSLFVASPPPHRMRSTSSSRCVSRSASADDGSGEARSASMTAEAVVHLLPALARRTLSANPDGSTVLPIKPCAPATP